MLPPAFICQQHWLIECCQTYWEYFPDVFEQTVQLHSALALSISTCPISRFNKSSLCQYEIWSTANLLAIIWHGRPNKRMDLHNAVRMHFAFAAKFGRGEIGTYPTKWSKFASINVWGDSFREIVLRSAGLNPWRTVGNAHCLLFVVLKFEFHANLTVFVMCVRFCLLFWIILLPHSSKRNR